MKKRLFALLSLSLMVGVLTSCTVSAENENDESTMSVTATIAEIEWTRDGAGEPIITTQGVQHGGVITLEAWDHKWWTITIEEIRDDYVVLLAEYHEPANGEKETERIEIAFGQEYKITTPTYGAAIEWTLLFTTV